MRLFIFYVTEHDLACQSMKECAMHLNALLIVASKILMSVNVKYSSYALININMDKIKNKIVDCVSKMFLSSTCFIDNVIFYEKFLKRHETIQLKFLSHLIIVFEKENMNAIQHLT